MNLTAQPTQRGCLHHIEGRRLYLSRGNLVLTGIAGQPLQVLARLPLGPWGSISASMRVSSRLMRHHIHHIAAFGRRVIVMGFGRIWCLDASTGELVGAPAVIVGGRPLALCVAGTALFYGEYRNNPERSVIRILGSEDGLKWSIVRELHDVRHIHGIYQDPFVGDLWMTTGDEDLESTIWRSSDQFANVERVLSGTQQARAISLLFTQKYVYFGSDTPLEPNFLYRLDRSTGLATRLVQVEGSVFHAATCGDVLLFSTAVEPSKANPSRDAVLYGSVNGEDWRVVARHRKDAWDMRYFQYGQLLLPSGDNETGDIWYSTFAVEPDNYVFSGKLHVR